VTPAHSAGHPHPSIYLLLILPFGAVAGYVTVSLAYLLTQSGMSTAQLGVLIAVFYAPQTWKFLWAPIVDTTLSRKTWYVLGTTLTAAGIVASGAASADVSRMAVFYSMLLLVSVASTFVCMSVESFIAHDTTEDEKGRAAGWLQAGGWLANGVGGGLALWLAQKMPSSWAGAVLGAVLLLCCLGLPFVAEPQQTHQGESVAQRMRFLIKDLWQVLCSRRGYLALLLVFLPIGSGAATNLFAAAADHWRTSAQTVALVTGALSGVFSGFGSLLGGYLADRIDRKLAYVVYSLLLVACALCMALAPHTERYYAGFVLVYSLITGMCFAAFSAVTLEAIGHGAAATKYNLFASLSNMPIAYLSALEGWAQGPASANGFLFVDAILGIAGTLVFCAVVLLTARKAAPLPA